MLTIVGNGPSRLKYDLNEIGEWWGCNRIYTDATPDLLFAGDIDMRGLRSFMNRSITIITNCLWVVSNG